MRSETSPEDVHGMQVSEGILTARGGLVDTAALLGALDSGRLHGAGLDVTDPEPLPIGHPLLGRADVIVTPHVSWGRLFNVSSPAAARDAGPAMYALFACLAIGIPLGILAARNAATETAILGTTGVVQTIPSLALLAALIPLTGRIGAVPAFIALALYALLPIVRNTHAALTQVPRGMVEAARSLGARPRTAASACSSPTAELS